MKTARYCPDCGLPITPGNTACSCGWNAGKTRSKSSQCDHDGRCQFTLGARRCPLPGNICNTPTHSGPWYCPYHSRNEEKDALAAQALDEIERIHGAIKTARDWRDEMVDERMQKLELIRKPGESRSAFIARCYQAMPKRLLKELGLTVVVKEGAEA